MPMESRSTDQPNFSGVRVILPVGGVSKSRVGEILGLEASPYLYDLLGQGLIYCDPSRGIKFLAADAVRLWVAVSHRHSRTQRARRVEVLLWDGAIEARGNGHALRADVAADGNQRGQAVVSALSAIRPRHSEGSGAGSRSVTSSELANVHHRWFGVKVFSSGV
jgi:hypothetical protein